MSSNNSPQDEEQTHSDAVEQMNATISQFLDNMFSNIDRQLDELSARYNAVKQAMDKGDALPLQREWEQLDNESSTGDMVMDDHILKIDHLWSNYLVKEQRWEEAERVMKKALTRPGTGGRALQKFESLLSLTDVLRVQNKNEEAYTLLHEHPLALQIEKISRSFPGSDNGARLAHARFDFAEEARLHLLAFEPSPLVPVASMMEAMRGDEVPRRFKAAYAFYQAGRISRALEETQKVHDASEVQLVKTTALCLMASWSSPRKGWEAVNDLLEEAQQSATSQTLVKQISVLRIMEASQMGHFARLEELAQQYLTDNSVRHQFAELRAIQGRYEEARGWTKKFIDTAETASCSSEDHRTRAMSLLGRVLVELEIAQVKGVWNQEETERDLERASDMLRGDQKLMLWISSYRAAIHAARGRRTEALQVADEVTARWEVWSDDVTTQKTISSQLGTAFLWLGEWDKAVFWFERYLEIGINPVYRTHYLGLLARALEERGDKVAARARRQEVIDSGLEIKAVGLAQQAGVNDTR